MSDEAKQLRDEGIRLFEEGSFPQAIETFGRAQEAFAAAGDEAMAAEMLNNVGVVYREQGEHDKALEPLEAALAAFGKLGDRSREAQSLGNLGGLYSALNDKDKAIESYRKAIKIFGDLDDHNREGETLMALGLMQFKNGQRSDGMAAYEAGLLLVDKPTARQKNLKRLLKVRQRLLGGWSPACKPHPAPYSPTVETTRVAHPQPPRRQHTMPTKRSRQALKTTS